MAAVSATFEGSAVQVNLASGRPRPSTEKLPSKTTSVADAASQGAGTLCGHTRAREQRSAAQHSMRA
jgi:hypothetical protein